MKYYFLSIILLLMFGSANAQVQYGYDRKSNSDNFVLFTSLSFSSSDALIHNDFGYSNTAKGAISTVPAIGVFYQKGIGSRFSLRVGFSLGFSSNAYKYATTYDSIGADFQPRNTKEYDKYAKYKTPTSFLQPQIELGYLFGPIKDMYIIEVRAGLGLQTYLSKNTDSVQITSGNVTSRKLGYTYKYFFQQSARYGDPDVYGSVVTNLYVGLKWQKTYNEFLNHFSFGIQATLPVTNSAAGYSTLEYKDGNFNTVGKQTIYLSQYSFGIRAAYNIL